MPENAFSIRAVRDFVEWVRDHPDFLGGPTIEIEAAHESNFETALDTTIRRWWEQSGEALERSCK